MSLPLIKKEALSKHAPVQEVFSSIQGEGIIVGKRQVFVRFAHCHLKCAYCDTPMTSANGNCQVEKPIASGTFEELDNPVSPEELLREVLTLAKTLPHHSVSFTGGEPLLYWAFLEQLLPHVQNHLPTYLETSGTQPEFVEPLLPWLNMVAMDIKLPSATKEPAQFENHALFYKTVESTPDVRCFIKLIFNQNSTIEELEWVSKIVTNRKTPIILQPETELETGRLKFNPEHLIQLERYLALQFEDVRVIPQTHKLLNVL